MLLTYRWRSRGSVFNSQLLVEMKSGSFEGLRSIAILPPSELEPRQKNGISASLFKSSRSKTIGSIYPTTLNLLNPVEVAVRFDAPLSSKTGLFIKSADI